MRIRLHILLVAWFVFGCSPRTDELIIKDTVATAPTAVVIPTETSAASKIDTSPPNIALRQLWEAGEEFGDTRTQIQAKLGKALEVRVKEVANRHGPWVDSVFTFRFDRTEVELLRAGYDGKEIVTVVTMWDSDRQLPAGLRVGGSSRQQIEASLGRPDTLRQEADTLQLKYYWDDAMLLHVIRDTLRMVEWRFYID